MAGSPGHDTGAVQSLALMIGCGSWQCWGVRKFFLTSPDGTWHLCKWSPTAEAEKNMTSWVWAENPVLISRCEIIWGLYKFQRISLKGIYKAPLKMVGTFMLLLRSHFYLQAEMPWGSVVFDYKTVPQGRKFTFVKCLLHVRYHKYICIYLI